MSSFKKKHRRRHSGRSNASIISIDHVSLNRLRKYQEKVEKKKKIERKKYQEKKRKEHSLQIDNWKKQEIQESNINDKYSTTSYLDPSNEIKEEDDEYEEFTKSKNNNYNKPKSSSSSSTRKLSSTENGGEYEDITVEELLPLIKNLVEKHNGLQQEYESLQRNLAEQKMIMEDKIIKLQQENEAFRSGNSNMFDNYQFDEEHADDEMSPTGNNKKNRINPQQELQDQMLMMKENYENNLRSLQSQYIQQIDSYEKKIKSLNKELNEGDKEIIALRQSLEAADHENEQLTMTINSNNKQFQTIKLLQNKNKSLTTENDDLNRTIFGLEQDLEQSYEEQQQQHQEILSLQQQMQQQKRGTTPKLIASGRSDDALNVHSPNIKATAHSYKRTIMMEVSTPKAGSTHGTNVTDTSSRNGDDLEKQLEVYNNYNDNNSAINDRDSTYDDYDDEKENEMQIQSQSQMQQEQGPFDDAASILEKFKNLKQYNGGQVPTGLQEIANLLQKKESDRNRGIGTQPSNNEIGDNFSVESNYSDSQQKLEEQIDEIEDEIRELKDMVSSLLDSTHNLAPQINSNLHPLIRKINRMYVMLSGGTMLQQSQTSQIDNNAAAVLPSRYASRLNGGSISGDETDYDNPSSQASNDESNKHDGDKDKLLNKYVALWITPYINDWMPSIGFSVIILSTMYLFIKYHRGRFIFGQPRVLRKR